MAKLFNPKSQKTTRQQLRNRMTRSEKILWYYLRGSNVEGYKFRRQQGVGHYVVDFYCPAAKLVIELDGDSHYQLGAGLKDIQRQKFIEAQGIHVIRFTDNDVCGNVNEVLAMIVRELHTISSPFEPPPTPP